jgi:signal transduction histidine kinase
MKLLPRLAWPIAALATAVLALTLYLGLTRPPVQGIDPFTDTTFIVSFWTFSLVGALITQRHPRNPIGPLCLGIGMTVPFSTFVHEYAVYSLFVSPGELPLGGLASWIGIWTWSLAFTLLTLTALRFPTGTYTSRFWRWVGRIIVAAQVSLFAVVLFMWPYRGRRLMTEDFAGPDFLEPLIEGIVLVIFVSLLLGFISLLLRFRRSRGIERQQLKWLGYFAGVAVVILPFEILLFPALGLEGSSLEQTMELVLDLSVLGFPLGIAIGILRYRLYDIDVVINRTLVYGALAAFITALYVGVVVGVGSLVGRGSESNLFLSLIATALVAVSFQPVRNRFQRIANRLVYGQRLSPYEAITSFSERMTESFSLDEVLPKMAAAAARAVAADRAMVSLQLPGGAVRNALWPSHAVEGSFDLSVPISHRGEDLGEISAAKKKGEPATEHDRELLSNLAAQAGIGLKNLRLTEELRQKLVEIEESRKRIVEAQDAERRRMERDIHDGAQQQLVALSVQLGLLEAQIDRNPAAARQLAEQVKVGVQETVESIRDLARGIFPSLLADRGLVAAVESHISKMGIDANVEANGMDGARFPPEIEANVYFCIREALQNASKHAPGSRITVALRRGRRDSQDFPEGQNSNNHADGVLTFEVVDAGPGFDPATTKTSSGLQNMRDRIEAVGGEFSIKSSPGRGTTVEGRILVRQQELAGAGAPS